MYHSNGMYHETLDDAIEDAHWLLKLLTNDDDNDIYYVDITQEVTGGNMQPVARVSKHGISWQCDDSKQDYEGDSNE